MIKFNKAISQSALGIDEEQGILKCAFLTMTGLPPLSSKTSMPIVRLFEIKADSAATSILLTENECLIDLMEQAATVTALPTHQILVRPLEIKLSKNKDVDAVFDFQVEPLLPYPLESAILNKITLNQNKQGTSLTFLSIKKDHLKGHLEKFKALQIDPEVVSSVPTALAAFSISCLTKDLECIILHLGASHSSAILVKNGKLIASYSIPEGLNTLIQGLIQDFPLSFLDAQNYLYSFPFDSFKTEEYPGLAAAIETFSLAITKVIYALTKQTKTAPSLILLTGSTATVPYLPYLLCHQLPQQLIVPNEGVLGLSSHELQKYAIPIGLALSSLPQNQDEINFRKNELAYSNPWKKLKKPLVAYFSLSFVIAFLVFIFGHQYHSYKENKLKIEYGDLLVAMDKKYENLEQDYYKKITGKAMGNDEKVIALVELNHEDIQNRVNFLQKDLVSTPDNFPLQPNVPRVSDVLAWLSTHPNILASKESNDKNAWSALLNLESFSYTMVNRPEKGKKNEKYKVKVELEFSSLTSTEARTFHDALIAPNPIVDPKSEVKWSANRGKYRTSFFLKDKTVYPTG